MDLTAGAGALHLTHEGVELARYVYEPTEARVESPRPYFHPLRTLGGGVVSRYRPADHVWHKGLAWSLPNVGPANFWGGPTYVRDRGYVRLANNGATRHRSFGAVGPAAVAEELDWFTEQGARWFTESRTLSFAVAGAAWTLSFATTFTNVTGAPIVLGSPTTQGRPDAGYGGLFWRGPESFTGGAVLVPGTSGGDELMGVRAPWLAFRAPGDTSTVLFAAESAVRWFVRSTPFAAVCPAPFFDTEIPADPGVPLTYRYRVTIADGAPDPAARPAG